MLWIAESMERIWQAYKEGLQLACPAHREYGEDMEEGENLVVPASEGSFRAEQREPVIRAFH